MFIHPTDILGQLIDKGLFSKRHPRYAKPGSVVSNLDRESRVTLAALTSKDIACLRDDVVSVYVEDDAQKKLSRMMLEFDARIPKKFRR